jgi:hypothetical protein
MKNARLHVSLVVAALAGLTWFAQSAASDSTEGTLSGIERQMEVGAEEVRERTTAGDSYKDRVDKGTALVGDFIGIANSWQEFTDAHDALTPDDRQFDPDYSPDGSPEIPSACAESEECNACYETAVKEINFYRFSLDKGRGIAKGTLDYAAKAIAFGDSASGSFGVGGLAWSLEAKPEVEKVVAKLRKTYNGKYEEWIAGMEKSLRALGECEEEYFGERDWYARFGYIYYSFMADRYKSPD